MFSKIKQGLVRILKGKQVDRKVDSRVTTCRVTIHGTGNVGLPAEQIEIEVHEEMWVRTYPRWSAEPFSIFTTTYRPGLRTMPFPKDHPEQKLFYGRTYRPGECYSVADASRLFIREVSNLRMNRLLELATKVIRNEDTYSDPT